MSFFEGREEAGRGRGWGARWGEKGERRGCWKKGRRGELVGEGWGEGVREEGWRGWKGRGRGLGRVCCAPGLRISLAFIKITPFMPRGGMLHTPALLHEAAT